MCMCDDGNVCFKRKSNICVAKFGNLGANGVKGSTFLVESVIFGIADPDLPINYATFMGLRWWLRVVYSRAPPLYPADSTTATPYYTVYQRSWWDACIRCRTLPRGPVHGSVITSHRYCDSSTGYQYDSVSISRLPSWYSSVWPATHLLI